MSRNKSRGSVQFANIPHVVFECPDYINLSPYALKLLLELVYQYNGFNNGDLCPSITLMAKRGFKSSATLRRVICELVAANMIVLTRQGGKNLASLYAIAWQSIDECPKKRLEINATKIPWRQFYIERQQGWPKKLDSLIQKVNKVKSITEQVANLRQVG
jgi:hypothetical protein